LIQLASFRSQSKEHSHILHQLQDFSLDEGRSCLWHNYCSHCELGLLSYQLHKRLSIWKNILLSTGWVTINVACNNSLHIIVVTLSIDESSVDGSFSKLGVIGVIIGRTHEFGHSNAYDIDLTRHVNLYIDQLYLLEISTSYDFRGVKE